MLTEATKENLRRKSAYVDSLQTYRGTPLPSWVDLSLTELCNRSAGSARPCVFCPRIDPNFYPNQRLYMRLDLAHKIAYELKGLKYQGVVVLCGFGEPLLHPRLADLVRYFAPIRVEIVTNGDRLTPESIALLTDAGVKYFVVSLYDGPHQVDLLTKKFQDSQVSVGYLLRDRWHTAADGFGLKLTNRAGSVSVGDQPEIDQSKPCHYLTYQMTVDWNGDVLLCPQDWNKKIRYGNLATQSLISVWNDPQLHKRRMELLHGRQNKNPCSSCNTDGTLHGYNHAAAWRAAHDDGHNRAWPEP
jgi:radical SAM protein with 4Fe4S-binding SPASM domain